jgi:hypothetical protein
MSQERAGSSATSSAEGPPGDGRRPIGVIVSSIVDGVRTLARQQVELAKIEAGEAVAARGMGAGMMGAAGVVGLFALVFAALSGSAALDLVMPTWTAHLIVAAVFGIAAAALVLIGRRAIRTAPKTERTKETLKEDARWAKRQLAR